MNNVSRKQNRTLTLIVFAQLAGTSLWFAGNAVIGDMSVALGLPPGALGPVVSAVQLGFIAGTLLFAILTIADRFSPSAVFGVCAIAGAVFNSAVLVLPADYSVLLGARFLTGVCLAGVYPVGMKIAADYFPDGLGRALGFLLGALVLGTATPHAVRALFADLPWRAVLISTSGLSTAGGLIVWLGVPDGTGRRAASKFDVTAMYRVFERSEFRWAAFGYFGHMWELYAFWTFVPVVLMAHHAGVSGFENSALTFGVIAVGTLSCILGGYISLQRGSAFVAAVAIGSSALCCVLSPLIFQLSFPLYAGFLFLWGFFVIADSPQFSTLVARYAPSEARGTALTIVNCIGFSITIFSIQLLNFLLDKLEPQWLLLALAAGPVFGLFFTWRLLRRGSQLSK